MTTDAFLTAEAADENAYITRRQYRCKLVNTRDTKIRVYFLKCKNVEEIHLMNAESSRVICLLEGQVVYLAFDVENCEYIGGGVLYINSSQTIRI